MIAGYSSRQVREAEAPSLERGVPLMRLAAAGLAREVRTVLPEDGGVVMILAGAGDNGGDALFAGAELAADGATVVVVRTANRIHEEAFAAAVAAGAREVPAEEAAAIAVAADVVIDGIVGTGASGGAALRGRARDIVAAVLPVLMENERAHIVAVDIPSGIDPDDGSVPDPLVLPADVTVTFGAYKAGLLVGPGTEFVGAIRLVDIGLASAYAAMEPAVTVQSPTP